MNDPSVHPLYVTSVEEILWGVVLVAITMVMHGAGMILTLQVNNAFKPRIERSKTIGVGLGVLILASWMVILVHLLEVAVWAGFFLWKGTLPNASLAYYFSLNEYTTVGSDYNLPLRWRLLEGMIATAGLLTFAWSTGVLLTLAQDFQERQLQLFKLRREKRELNSKPKSDGADPPSGKVG